MKRNRQMAFVRTPAPAPAPVRVGVTELVDRANAAIRTMSRHNANRHLMLQLAAGLGELAGELEARRDSVKQALDKTAPWRSHHHATCNPTTAETCTCGLASMISELLTLPGEVPHVGE